LYEGFATKTANDNQHAGGVHGTLRMPLYDFVIFEHDERPLKNAQFCSSPRKAKILTTGIH
jgi:hypothetical protein